MGIDCLFIEIQWNPALRPPRYYSHCFCLPSKNIHTFSCKETLVNMVTSRYYSHMFLAPW